MCSQSQNCHCKCHAKIHESITYAIIESVLTESVDSIILCRDSVDMQYMITKKNFIKLVNLWAFITTYHSSSSIFMMNNTPTGVKKHHKSTKPLQKVARWPKRFFFFSFRRTSSNCMTLSQWSLHKTAALYTESTSPSLFQTLKSHEAGHWRTVAFISDTNIKNCAHAHKWLSLFFKTIE